LENKKSPTISDAGSDVFPFNQAQAPSILVHRMSVYADVKTDVTIALPLWA